MTSRGQLILFEALSGVFGWVWIGATIAVLVLVGFAIFSDWSWWNVLYAVILGGVAKWLAKGFLDNKTRVLFEQQMVEQGMTKEEAAKKWAGEYGKGRLG